MKGGCCLLALACCVTAGPATAQVSRALTVSVGAASTRLRATTAEGGEALSGVAASGAGALAVGPVVLEAFYAQGRLLPDSGSPPARDLVDGGVLLSVRPVGWLTLKGGAHLRAFVTTGGSERWVLGEMRARFDGALVGTTVRTHIELWRALASDVNVAPGAEGAQGGEVGLTVRLPRAPLWGRLAYGIDRANVKTGTRGETLEVLTLSVGYGGR